jgi:hypothetical protein
LSIQNCCDSRKIEQTDSLTLPTAPDYCPDGAILLYLPDGPLGVRRFLSVLSLADYHHLPTEAVVGWAALQPCINIDCPAATPGVTCHSVSIDTSEVPAAVGMNVSPPIRGISIVASSVHSTSRWRLQAWHRHLYLQPLRERKWRERWRKSRGETDTIMTRTTGVGFLIPARIRSAWPFWAREEIKGPTLYSFLKKRKAGSIGSTLFVSCPRLPSEA